MTKKLLLRVAIVLVLLVVVAVVASMFFLGSVVKKGVETVGPVLTKTGMKLESASLSVLSGSGSLKGFEMGNPEGFKTPYAVKVGKTSIGVRPGSVFSDKVHIKHVRVEAPEITFEAKGVNVMANNLSKILDNVKTMTGSSEDKSQEKPTEEAARKLQVDDFLITGARLNLSSTLLGGKDMTVPLPDIHLTNLGQGPEGITAGELTQKVMGEVTTAAVKAAQNAVASVAKGATEAVKQLGESGTDAVKSITKGVGDLFKKKQ